MINKIISVIFVVSGVFMLLMLFQTIPSEIQSGLILTAITDLLFLVLYALSIFAGIQIWRNKKIGKSLSWYLLLFQTISFDLSVVNYRFTSLLDFFVYYRIGESIGYDSYFGAGRFTLSFPETSANLMFGVNLVAIILLVMLSKTYLPDMITQLVAWINEDNANNKQGNFA